MSQKIVLKFLLQKTLNIKFKQRNKQTGELIMIDLLVSWNRNQIYEFNNNKLNE